jgi:hypothetical protein
MTTTAGSNVGSVQVTAATVQTTANVTTTTTAKTITLNETSILYIRPRTVEFYAQGLKPNTIYYPFFNGASVDQFCSAVDGVLTSPLKTNALGDLKGHFYLPANKFLCGSLKFQLVDNTKTVGGSLVPDPIYGGAEAQYEANGSLKLQQTQLTSESVVNVNTAVTSVNPVVTPSVPVSPPAIQQCESWFFEYSVASSSVQIVTISTNSVNAPHTNVVKAAAGFTNSTSPGEATYLSTTAVGNGTFNHTFAFRATRGGSDVPVNIFRQEWIGTSTDSRPSLTGFKPSGLPADSIVTITTNWTKIADVACPVNLGLGAATVKSTKSVAPYDPLAQSFFIESSMYPDGVFVTGISVYFRTVDQATPVVLELRNMNNGLPGSNIFPGGTVLVPGAATAQSPDGSIPTFFRFDFPIYLKPNDEYCFVVKSSSLGYNLWCSKIGEIDVKTAKVIDSQQAIGNLFLSENNYTWLPDPYQDIKFDLNIAVFDTTKTINTIFNIQGDSATPTKYFGTAVNLPLSYIYTTKGSKVVDITIPMHGLVPNDKIMIEGIATPTPSTAYNNLVASSLNGIFTCTVVDEDTVRITTAGANNANKTGFLNIKDEFNVVDVTPPITVAGSPLQTDIPTIINRGTNSSPTVPTATTLNFPTPPVLQSDKSFTVYSNIRVNEVMVDYMATNFAHTTISDKINIAEDDYTGIATVFDLNHKDYQPFESPRLIAIPQNETIHSTTLSNKTSATVNIQGTSSNKYVSPVIDINGISVNVRSYKIDNQSNELITTVNATALVAGQPYMIHTVGTTDFTLVGAVANTPGICFIATGAGTGTGVTFNNSEISPLNGRAAAKYKTIVRQTSEFHQLMNLFVDANCPSPAEIDAYIRVSADINTHAEQDWRWMPLNGVYGTSFVNSPTRFAANEHFYSLTTDILWNVYDIKLVMRSTNSSVVPKIYSIRTITDVI